MRDDGAARYRSFVRDVKKARTTWGLFRDGWALCGDPAGRQAFALWPSREAASACARGEWAGFEPQEIPLDALIEELAPSLAEDGVMTAVFPTPADGGVITEVAMLVAALRG